MAKQPNLTMDHIKQPTLEIIGLEEEDDNKEVPIVKTISFISKSGKYKATVVNTILSASDESKVGQLFAQLTGGVSSSSLPAKTATLLYALAHMSVSCKVTNQQPKDWYENRLENRVKTPVLELWDEVAMHENMFQQMEEGL